MSRASWVAMPWPPPEVLAVEELRALLELHKQELGERRIPLMSRINEMVLGALTMTEVLEVEEAIIFINYRRTDAGWPADLLSGELGRSFGTTRVFQDVRGIDAGDDFVAVLDNQLHRATILIVLIGSNWLRVSDKFGRRRLDQEQDWVRREIRMALQKPGCRVIPVLIDDAELPEEREALPEDISALVTRQ